MDGEVEAQVPASSRPTMRTLAPSHDQGGDKTFTLGLKTEVGAGWVRVGKPDQDLTGEGRFSQN